MKKALYYINKILIYLLCIFFINLQKVYKKRINSKEILVISVQHLGESILFLDALRSLRVFYGKDQGYTLRFIGNQNTIDFYKAFLECDIDEYISIDQKWELGTRNKLSAIKFIKLYRYLSKYKFSIIINPFQNFWGPILLASLRSEQQYSLYIEGSWGNKRSNIEKYVDNHMANHVVLNKKDDMLLVGYRNLLREVGIIEYQSKIGRISIENTSRHKNNNFLSSEKYCVVVPGAMEKARQWKIDRYTNCIQYIIKHLELTVILVGSRSEIELGNTILMKLNEQIKLVNLIGTTDIKELAEVIAGAEFVLGNDTGTIHLSASLGIPSLFIMSYKDIGRCQPYVLDEVKSDDKVPIGIWCEPRPKCAGCNINSDMLDRRIDWINHTCKRSVREEKIFKCLNDITEQQVVRQIQKMYTTLTQNDY